MKTLFALVTLQTAAKTLAVSVKTVRRMVSDGQLKACRIRSGLRISKASLDGYVKNQIEKFQLDDSSPVHASPRQSDKEGEADV